MDDSIETRKSECKASFDEHCEGGNRSFSVSWFRRWRIFDPFGKKLEAVFMAFQKACDSFKAMLSDEDDIDECCAYFSEGEGRFFSTRQRLHNIGDSDIHDSVSQTSHSKHSSTSKYSKSSSISSAKSTLGKKMLQNATRKANLIAEGSLLARRQSLVYQEMKLNQLKEEFQLQEEFNEIGS